MRAALLGLSLTLALLPFVAIAADSDRHSRPADAAVYLQSPSDGAVVPEKFTVRMGLRNMGIAPAGVDKPNTGHHHLLIDTEVPPLDEPIPLDATHMHFGGGQTEAVITLPPGKHTLQLLLGDTNHLPHEPPLLSKKITIEVKPDAREP